MIKKFNKQITVNFWDNVKQGVNINFDDYINMDNDLEVCGYLSESDIIQLTVRGTQSYVFNQYIILHDIIYDTYCVYQK